MNKRRFVTGIILIILLLFSFIGGTSLAKYLSSSTSKVSTPIAKWNISDSILVNGTLVTTTPINLAPQYDVQKILPDKIAPGTSGKFTVKINAAGTDTGVDYKVTFTNISNSNIENLNYTYKGKTYSSLSALQNDLKGTISATAVTKTASFEIGWSWPYETLDSNKSPKAGDAKDLEVSQSSSNFGFDVNVICTQVSPITT